MPGYLNHNNGVKAKNPTKTIIGFIYWVLLIFCLISIMPAITKKGQGGEY